MTFLNRLIPWTASVIIFIFFEMLLKQPEQIFWLVPLMILTIAVSVWQLTGRKILKLRFWNFLITPILLLNSGWLFFIFLEGQWLRHVFLIILAILLWLFLKVIFLYFHLRPKYQSHTLENISSYLNLITIFLFSSSFFNFLIFLNYPLWSLFLLGVIFSGLLVYQIFWASEVSFRNSRLYIFIITLVIAEIFLATSFLPTSVYVNGSIITIAYYLLTGLARNWLLDIKEPKVIRRYLINSLIFFIIILLSAKWI